MVQPPWQDETNFDETMVTISRQSLREDLPIASLRASLQDVGRFFDRKT